MNAKSTHLFRVSGIPADVIEQMRLLTDDELKKQRAVRRIVDARPGFPCRVTLEDAEIGESVLLFNFEHLPGPSPYRSVGPIYVRESASKTYSKINEIPEVLRVADRVFSVRAYDETDLLVEAEVIKSVEIDGVIQRLFANASTAYIHVHYAGPGCYSCRIDRS
jgi:hypothetical protein